MFSRICGIHNVRTPKGETHKQAFCCLLRFSGFFACLFQSFRESIGISAILVFSDVIMGPRDQSNTISINV